MLRCNECWCVSEFTWGWVAYISEDPEAGEASVVATYCPPCAARVLDAQPRDEEYV